MERRCLEVIEIGGLSVVRDRAAEDYGQETRESLLVFLSELLFDVEKSQVACKQHDEISG